MIKSYLINLDRSEERLKRFEGIAVSLRLTVVRIPAVDGSRFTPAELKTYENSASRFGPLGPGEIGCFLSHRIAWETILQNDDEWAAVFEDDVYLSRDATTLLDDVSWIPQGTDIIKLETTRIPVSLGDQEGEVTFTEIPRKLFPLLSPHGGAGGYLISRHAARELIGDPETVRDPIDEYLFNPVSAVVKKMSVLQLSPALCIQHVIVTENRSDASLNSTIQHERDKKWQQEWERNRPIGFAKLWREASRPFRQISNYLGVPSVNRKYSYSYKPVDYR